MARKRIEAFFHMQEGSPGNLPPPNQKYQSVEYEGRKGVVVDDYWPALTFTGFLSALHAACERTDTRKYQKKLDIEHGLRDVRHLAKDAHKRGKKIIFIGNGGSSAISSHMAVDWTKNGGIRSISLNDAPTLTCLANDFGYENVFAKQLEYYARPGDVVIIISSSGKSDNIIKAAEQTFAMGLDLVTFSGMRPTNVLRRKGMISFYVPAKNYGVVELAHLTLLHSIVSVQW